MGNKLRIGILTSGGDCPGLNAAIRGVAKAAYERLDAQIVGIAGGYRGLIECEAREMSRSDFSGILTLGGTILGTSRQPFRTMRVTDENQVDKIELMKKHFKELKLDCLVTLGGNGTHKTANLLSEEGIPVIGLPKTIDNDIFGTDVTFGFHTAVDIATECIDRLHTTAASHGRVLVAEIMGNKVGWLTLYAGIAGGADIILLPEIPYDLERVMDALSKRRKQGKSFSIMAVAEGAMDMEEAAMKKKDRERLRAEQPFFSVAQRIAAQLSASSSLEVRAVIPGHIQRGGSPSPYDRVFATRLGTYAVGLIERGEFGVTVALRNNEITHNRLCDIAGVAKPIPFDHPMLTTALDIGINLGGELKPKEKKAKAKKSAEE